MRVVLLLVLGGLIAAASVGCSARVVGAADVYSDVRRIDQTDPAQQQAAADAAAHGLASSQPATAPAFVADAAPKGSR